MRKPDDDTMMSDVTGLRAVWWLYKRGLWSYLEDFGLRREDVEPALVKFDAENVIKNRLTRPQARKLARRVPQLREASVELRLTYALKMYDETIKQGSALEAQRKPGSLRRPSKGKRKKSARLKDKKHMTKRYYHAEVTDEHEDPLHVAEGIAAEYADSIVKAGGTLDVGRSFDGNSAMLIASLPDHVNYSEVLPNRVTWQQVAFYAAAAVPDNGVPSDEEPPEPPPDTNERLRVQG